MAKTVTRSKVQERPVYAWLQLPDDTTAQGEYLEGLLREVQRDIDLLARQQYSMLSSEYRERIAELYACKRIILAFRSPHNNLRTMKKTGHPTLGCMWMKG
jgi:hypothetical protein